MQGDDIDQLKRRLQWEAGPLTDLSNRATGIIFAYMGDLTRWLRVRTEKQPLVSLLLALQIGFVVGYWGPRRAKH